MQTRKRPLSTKVCISGIIESFCDPGVPCCEVWSCVENGYAWPSICMRAILSLTKNGAKPLHAQIKEILLQLKITSCRKNCWPCLRGEQEHESEIAHTKHVGHIAIAGNRISYYSCGQMKSRKSLGSEPLNVQCWCIDYNTIHVVCSRSHTRLQWICLDTRKFFQDFMSFNCTCHEPLMKWLSLFAKKPVIVTNEAGKYDSGMR